LSTITLFGTWNLNTEYEFSIWINHKQNFSCQAFALSEHFSTRWSSFIWFMIHYKTYLNVTNFFAFLVSESQIHFVFGKLSKYLFIFLYPRLHLPQHWRVICIQGQKLSFCKCEHGLCKCKHLEKWQFLAVWYTTCFRPTIFLKQKNNFC
jgi:hypothetical protein